MYGKLLICLLITVGFIFPWLVNAQQEPTSLGLSVNPQIFELDVFPGETHNLKIKVGNLSDVPMPIEVLVTDFTAAEISGEMLFDESLQDPSIASRKWFEIENPNFILEAKEKEELHFKILVPENAEPGGHYSVILFEPRLPSFYFKEGQPRAIPVVGVLFLLSVKTLALEPEVQQKLEVVEFSLLKEERIVFLENFFSSFTGSIALAAKIDINILEKSPSKFILQIKNNDIYHHKPGGKLVIYNTFGKKVGETDIRKTTILPGKTRQLPVEIIPEIPEKLKWLPAAISSFLIQNTSFGKYKTVLSLEIPGQKLESESQFWAFPWKILLPLLFLITGTVLLRKRIFAAVKIFMGCK